MKRLKAVLNRGLITMSALSIIFCNQSHAEVSPGVVGWGNSVVPGLGATLRGESIRGFAEMSSEIGLYYGGTFGAKEGSFSIDGSVLIPTNGTVYRPLLGQMLQEAGLKLHMYDTFYNYQQAARAVSQTEREKSNPQPLYQGSISDQVFAPFRWKNLSNPWVYPLILVSGVYLFYSYATTAVPPQAYRANGLEDKMYGLSQMGIIPFGSVVGEEAYFRGFVQRETRLYTGSVIASLLIQSTLFAAIHPPDLRPSAFASGIYFGMMVNHFGGNIEQAITAHYWVNVIDGIITYLQFRRTQGLNTPFNPPIGLAIKLPI